MQSVLRGFQADLQQQLDGIGSLFTDDTQIFALSGGDGFST